MNHYNNNYSNRHNDKHNNNNNQHDNNNNLYDNYYNNWDRHCRKIWEGLETAWPIEKMKQQAGLSRATLEFTFFL